MQPLATGSGLLSWLREMAGRVMKGMGILLSAIASAISSPPAYVPHPLALRPSAGAEHAVAYSFGSTCTARGMLRAQAPCKRLGILLQYGRTDGIDRRRSCKAVISMMSGGVGISCPQSKVTSHQHCALHSARVSTRVSNT